MKNKSAQSKIGNVQSSQVHTTAATAAPTIDTLLATITRIFGYDEFEYAGIGYTEGKLVEFAVETSKDTPTLITKEITIEKTAQWLAKNIAEDIRSAGARCMQMSDEGLLIWARHLATNISITR